MTYVFNPFTGTLDDVGSGVTPGGSNTQVQFNDNNTFGGDVDLTFNKTTNALSTGSLIVTSSTVPANGLYLPASNTVALSTNSTQRLKIDSNGYTTGSVGTLAEGLYLPCQYYRLNSGFVGSNVNTAQSVLGVGVTLAGSTVYEFEGVYVLQKTAGTNSHTLGLGYAGTATINNITSQILNSAATTASTTATNLSIGHTFSSIATNVDLSVNVTNASATRFLRVKGTVSINAGGTFIPQYTLSSAPGGAYTTLAGSYFRIAPLGAAGSNISIGTWA